MKKMINKASLLTGIFLAFTLFASAQAGKQKKQIKQLQVGDMK